MTHLVELVFDGPPYLGYSPRAVEFDEKGFFQGYLQFPESKNAGAKVTAIKVGHQIIPVGTVFYAATGITPSISTLQINVKDHYVNSFIHEQIQGRG